MDLRQRTIQRLNGHALKDVFLQLPHEVQNKIAIVAHDFVVDVAASTQDRSLLPGEPDANEVMIEAIFGNAILMLIRYEDAKT